jgi:hypothetical protein
LGEERNSLNGERLQSQIVKRFLKGSLEGHPDILWIRVVFKSTSGMFKCVTTKCSLQVSCTGKTYIMPVDSNHSTIQCPTPS